MAQDVNFAVQIHGLEQVLALLRRLPIDLQKKGLNKAMRAGANVVRKAAAANIKAMDDRKSKERIFANVVAQYASRSSRRLGGVMFRVGVLGGAKQYGNTKENVRARRVGKSYRTGGDKGNPGGDTWYWRFVEFGVPSRGISARRPMTKALSQNSERSIGVIVYKLGDAITAEVLKRRAV